MAGWGLKRLTREEGRRRFRKMRERVCCSLTVAIKGIVASSIAAEVDARGLRPKAYRMALFSWS